MWIPYSRKEIDQALIELRSMKFDRDSVIEKLAELQAELEAEIPSDTDALNKKLSEYYGIDEGILSNDFFREPLLPNYIDSVIERTVKKVAEMLQITEVQAWALFVSAMEDYTPSN